MLLIHFSFISVLQMLIEYSAFLINIYLGILVFHLGIFVNVKTFLTNSYILCLIVALNITDFVLSY